MLTRSHAPCFQAFRRLRSFRPWSALRTCGASVAVGALAVAALAGAAHAQGAARDPVPPQPSRPAKAPAAGQPADQQAAEAAGAAPVRLTVKEVPMTILGKERKVMTIVQPDGVRGWSPARDEGFDVEVVNELSVPTTIHWHGLVLPNLMDGVPFVTQPPIAPGRSARYRFPLKQSGTYWMHSHYGLQEQAFNVGPLIIWSPEELAKAETQHVVLLSDFSEKPADAIFRSLRAGMQMGDGKAGSDGQAGAANGTREDGGHAHPAPPDGERPAGEHRMPMPGAKTAPRLMQVWDDQAQRFTRRVAPAPQPDIDVLYDALLANFRTADDPEILPVAAGETALLRLIAASAATNFFIDTGSLEAELLAVDGKPVKPVRGDFFQLAVAQRIDLRVTIPPQGGAFPILALGEGTDLVAAVVLATPGAEPPVLSPRAATAAGGLDNTQEKRLRAATPLAPRVADRTLPARLGGDMQTYDWTINGLSYPNRTSLDVKEGERVELVMANDTAMSHPMHLHGHDVQVVAIDGVRLDGAMRDTVLVPPGSTITVAFDADNPGVWAFHCHVLYHLAAGMFTVVKYDGADTQYWQPELTRTELLVSPAPPAAGR